jgi:hypothetical protein
MSTLQQQIDVSSALAAADAPISIPGLDPKAIIKNMIEIQFKPQLDEIKASYADAKEAEAEIKATKERLTEYFNTDAAQTEIKNQINIIKINVKAAIEGVKQMPIEISTMIANNAVPPTLPIPTAPGVPNPVSILLKGKEKVSALKTILNAIAAWFVGIFAAANKISFQLPDSIIAMASQVAQLKTLIGSIPV